SRITTILRDKGYYSFTKDYIKFRIDSSEVTHKVDVTVLINQALIKTSGSDSLIEDNHKRFTISRVYITLTPSDLIGKDETKYDTLVYTDKGGDIFYFLHYGKIMYKPSALLSHIYIKPGLYYRSKEVESTYKKLTGLNTFRVVNLNLDPDLSDPFQPGLDTRILLTPLKRHIFVSEATGTNRGGNLGASVNLTYKNRNIFRGAEQLSIAMHGGMEAQQLLTNQDDQIVTGVVSEILPINTFNTIEFGPEISLSFPKFLVPFNVFKFSKNSNPKTVFNAKFNYQRRPDFSRAIQEASLSYDWQKVSEETHEEYDFHFSPLKLSAVKLPRLSDQFRSHLNGLSDPLLKYSYTDHLVLGLLGGVTYSVQKSNRTKDMMYIKANVEQSGLSMYSIFKSSNAPKDSIGSYEILGIRFAHFIKVDLDFRYFININKSSRMAYRTMAGIGIPLANLNEALPFEKAFYAGGANGLRGWRARTIGPGAYYDTIAAFDKIGEFQLEGNLEYRFELIKVVEAALFVDAGNVWLLKKNDGRPQGHLTPQFYEQIAMDGGIGLRLDFDFFIFRFDFAVPLRDPGFPDGEKWIFQPKTTLNEWRKGYSTRHSDYVYKPYRFPITLNFAIGYPF
ncbi:MAG: BamA/TamA family outer membrane protein, partial [Flavobacteriales bacterium]